MRKAIAILLICVFSVQFLPIKEVGRLLYGQSMTEELPVHEIIVKKNAECIKVHDLHFIAVNHPEFFVEKNYIISDETLVKIHHPEVLLQPPNVIS